MKFMNRFVSLAGPQRIRSPVAEPRYFQMYLPAHSHIRSRFLNVEGRQSSLVTTCRLVTAVTVPYAREASFSPCHSSALSTIRFPRPLSRTRMYVSGDNHTAAVFPCLYNDVSNLPLVSQATHRLHVPSHPYKIVST